MIYYKGIVGHYTIVLKFHRPIEKNGKNVLKGEYQKEGIEYEGEMVPLGYSLQSSHAYNFSHAIFSTCTYD